MRHQKMFHAEAGHAMVHAGLLPQWTIERACALGREVESELQGPDYSSLLRHLYGNAPDRWEETLTGYDRLRVIVNAMTRLRLCDADGRMEFSHKAGLDDAPRGFMPWFEVPGRASGDTPVICGHWAALGLVTTSNVAAIDTGCVWGRDLTALRLDDRRLYQCGCSELQGTATD